MRKMCDVRVTGGMCLFVCRSIASWPIAAAAAAVAAVELFTAVFIESTVLTEGACRSDANWPTPPCAYCGEAVRPLPEDTALTAAPSACSAEDAAKADAAPCPIAGGAGRGAGGGAGGDAGEGTGEGTGTGAGGGTGTGAGGPRTDSKGPPNATDHAVPPPALPAPPAPPAPPPCDSGAISIRPAPPLPPPAGAGATDSSPGLPGLPRGRRRSSRNRPSAKESLDMAESRASTEKQKTKTKRKRPPLCTGFYFFTFTLV